ncbi:hypothetical protein BDR03DRAFT_955150 [Suillus americanus]|nr:hypothetical protein BDR03DRAFT_955150 [Suillus americanus]
MSACRGHSILTICRALHARRSADYVWRRSAISFDLPLDLIGDVVVASLSSNELYPRKASCIISRCDTQPSCHCQSSKRPSAICANRERT